MARDFFTLAAQLGRHWAEHTALGGGVTFIERTQTLDDHDTLGDTLVYAAPLPTLKMRRSRAGASITPIQATAGETGQYSETKFGVLVTARAPREEAALAIAQDFFRTIYPSDGTRPDGIYTSVASWGKAGLLGMPTTPTGNPLDVWRIVYPEIEARPTTDLNGFIADRAPSGEAQAALTMQFTVVPESHTPPVPPPAEPV